jgi:hypothetical protein
MQHTATLMGTGFNFISATVSLYFIPEGDSKKGRALHIGLKPTGISNLRDMEEADARLAEKLVLALGVMQQPPTAEAADQPATAVEGACSWAPSMRLHWRSCPGCWSSLGIIFCQMQCGSVAKLRCSSI